MARNRAPSGPKPVEAIVHADKRKNLPTADAQEFVTPEIETAKALLYPRRPELDPQLVWRGKDEQDREDLEIEAPPIYIQEKIDPRVLIENLRNTSRSGSPEPEMFLFDSFDGLGDLELVEFYQHSANWSNRLILGDSLNVMASLAEREGLRGQVQMVYVDPPYGIKFGSNWQVSVRGRDVKDGDLASASREVEQIKAFRDTWELGIHSYLHYLRDRLEVSRDLLSPSGSIFVQMNVENQHLVRSLLDEVFGSDNFCGLITYQKTSGMSSPTAKVNVLASVADFLIWYAKDRDQVKYRQLYADKGFGAEGAGVYTRLELPDGTRRQMTEEERNRRVALPDGARVYRIGDITSMGWAQSGSFDYEYGGRRYSPGKSRHWTTTRDGMDRLSQAGRIAAASNSLQFVRYWDDFPVSPLDNVWTDTGTGSFTDPKVYVVQTKTRVVERCILMTTDPGDLVLDPTCGGGTTAYAAEQWGRRWITADTSRVALALTRQRLMASMYPYYLLADSAAGRQKEQELSGTVIGGPPPEGDVRRGFVYERVRHVTLRSIASCPDIHAGMSRTDIDKAVRRNAEYELLYDRPIQDQKRIRVSGPFTVESLSPHRSLAFAPTTEAASERAGAQMATSATFEESVLGNLGKAGIQNGRRNERLEFEALEPYAGRFIQSVGVPRDGAKGPGRTAVAVGPQYGTVGPSFIKDAAREAIKDSTIDLLCVLGFAFDPTALGASDEYNATAEGFANVAAERSLGRIPVLLVRMNSDLVMGENLKKTGSANLFTVFGEPDISISGDESLVVAIQGVDVYDPTTGEVRSHGPDRIAMWMIDSNYNGESFFVRHCYFTGGSDPYKRLRAALKADISEDAWASLYRTASVPFPKPETGKIAVKVINDYGDEVLKVFDV